ncbi:DUF3500 domain-containing protein [Anaeromyxobacter oryzae]|uniref:DUF3500 domain-containing protein n=1 Tax=Anaeromyxobacter oryzae TaxID=2918170 RepID=A0ABM7WZ27_9BACT|nr:DUF3500 domain-containing protein [Anaeromyxobacter oryzae]BDG04784.1 hypothetical protein AMOR_37800 [Anaeromyxobacter oryzae]
MRDEAVAFLRSLTPEQRRRATFPIDGPERLDWHYVPRERPGLPLGEMDDDQRAAAHALLRSALSDAGYRKATDIMRLEEVLRAMERVRRSRRDPDNYAWSIFGDPEAESAWGWRVEGHHLSLNFTFADHSVLAVTPAFMGANPAKIPSGPLASLRVLGTQEDIAREVVRSLAGAQRERTIIAARSLGDIVSGPGRADMLRSPAGLPIGDMGAAQRAVAERLIEEFVANLRTELAEAQRDRIREAGLGAIHFAWAGPVEPGHAHYFRLHGPRLLVEHDNTQNDANHVHSVWRDPGRDFALDVLGEHYRAGPHAVAR